MYAIHKIATDKETMGVRGRIKSTRNIIQRMKEFSFLLPPILTQWRNHARAITGSARVEFIFVRVAPVLKMSRVSCA